MRLAILLLVFCAAPAPAGAQPDTATLNVVFGGLARLSLSSNTLTFPDADPDSLPLVPAAGGPITVVAKARATEGSLVLLTVQASDDLRSGMTTLPASMLTWTATGPGFVPGTVATASPQTVASWVGSGVHSGTQEYLFRNLWTHPTGTYTLTLVYTLTAA